MRTGRTSPREQDSSGRRRRRRWSAPSAYWSWTEPTTRVAAHVRRSAHRGRGNRSSACSSGPLVAATASVRCTWKPTSSGRLRTTCMRSAASSRWRAGAAGGLPRRSRGYRFLPLRLSARTHPAIRTCAQRSFAASKPLDAILATAETCAQARQLAVPADHAGRRRDHRHRHLRADRPRKAGPGMTASFRDRRLRLRRHGPVLRRARRDGAGIGSATHYSLCGVRRAAGVDGGLAPDPGVRHCRQRRMRGAGRNTPSAWSSMPLGWICPPR